VTEPTEWDEARTVPGSASADPNIDWAEAARQPSFRELVSTKVRFLVPLVIFYLVFYLAVTVLAGFAPGFMSQRAVGPINVGYLLILATYVMAWIVALVYVRIANRSFDPKADRAIDDLHARKDEA
jgi:uncharacterized membrane protein (DUF485 family)